MDESLQISGTWMNKYTGDIVRVHNNIIDGDQMILITDKGQITMNEFSDNYIQASEDIYNDQGQIIDHAPVAIDEIKISQPSILDIPIGITTSNYTQVIKENNTEKNKQTEEPESFKILDKFFNKIDNKENLITIDIDFNILPKEKLETIVDYMDISVEELSQYIAKKIVNTENLPNIIFNKLQYWISDSK